MNYITEHRKELEENKHLKQFCEERVRHCGHKEIPEILDSQVDLRELVKAYTRWAIGKEDAPKTNKEEIERFFTKEFLYNRTIKFLHMRVFLDEEDVEEFDKEHNIDAAKTRLERKRDELASKLNEVEFELQHLKRNYELIQRSLLLKK